MRASFSDMKKYIGVLGTAVEDSSIKFAANYTCQAFSLSPGGANALGWVQEDFIDKPAPSIDSETGEAVQVSSDAIIPEVLEHSCYLMQTIRIGSSEVLVFFDRGANIHIIDGSIAEKEGLQKVSSNPTSLTVVGGNKVKSDHGTYRFNLGPGENGEFHEVVCIGMNDVTAGFGSYNLSEITEEYRDQAGGEEKDVALPEKVGGSRVHLLLGIKNTNLDPVLIKILESGIAVYLSPFKDIYGSRLIFAGPHKSFTKSDDGLTNEMSNAVFFMREQVHERLRMDSEQRCFSITVNEKLGTTINPYPINEEDLMDCDGVIPEQFEESLDVHDKLLDLLSGTDTMCKAHSTQVRMQKYCETQNNLQSIHRAQVPITKFRDTLDDEEIEDKLGFRCAEFEKRLTCKTSSKRTAISLREAREQQFIESSVKVDLKLRKVLVNYPFLKDPVEYLSKIHKNPNNFGQAVKVYKTQCRKSIEVKDGMRKVHADLVDKGFMKKLDDMPEKTREMIKNAPFQHYNPWRLVMKMDSMTTPVRMVVDPTMTSFNEILAKGENNIASIFTIMIDADARSIYGVRISASCIISCI